MPSDIHNLSIMEKATVCFDVALAQEVPLAYHSTYNAYFMDLPVLSAIFVDSKSVNLVMASFV